MLVSSNDTIGRDHLSKRYDFVGHLARIKAQLSGGYGVAVTLNARRRPGFNPRVVPSNFLPSLPLYHIVINKTLGIKLEKKLKLNTLRGTESITRQPTVTFTIKTFL